MIWLIVLGAVGLAFIMGVVLRSRAGRVATPPAAPVVGWADQPIPQDASLAERVIGLVVVGATLLGVAALRAGDGEPLGPLVTAPAVAGMVVVGALLGAGPRGRNRFSTALFESNRRLVGRQGNYRLYEYTGDKDRRLRALGSEPTVMAVLALAAVVILAKPFISPNVERVRHSPVVSSGPPGMPPMPAAMRADLAAAAAAGDPRAMRLRSAFGGSEAAPSTHLTFDGYTAERNVAWPATALVLLLVALRLLLTPASLATPRSPLAQAASSTNPEG